MPAWSSETEILAATIGYSIHLLDTERGVWTDTNQDVFDEASPTWSPDGRLLAYIWYLPVAEIHLMNSNGTQARSLGSPPVAGTSPCFLAARPQALTGSEPALVLGQRQ